ncbi:MAG TPA: ABC transporter permease subunit [Polyangiaceae bacterium]|nr:ABC transporter permease subunit [Polyangiaceae bacterium]
MSGYFAVFRREMLSLWVTPLAWVLLVVFLLLEGTIFYSIVVHFTTLPELSVDTGPVQAFFGQESILLLLTLILLCPALSMRCFAEERRSGTIESLLTAPVSAHAVVLAKYSAVLATYMIMWAPTLLYVIILRKTGSVDFQVVATSYAGLLGVGASYLAIGTLMSAMTRSQLVALLLTVFVVFGLFLMGIGEYVFEEGLFRDLCAHVSMASQMEDFSKGVVDLRRIVFDFSVVALCLFLTVRVVDSWRWD